MAHEEKRKNPELRRLVTAGNNAALLASDPDSFSMDYRRQVVRAWDSAVENLRGQANPAAKEDTPC